VVDRQGIPLAVTQSPANAHDSTMLEATVDAIRPTKRPSGQRRKRPAKLHADKGYDFPRCREALRRRGIKGRIARRGVDSSEKLGRHRWVVERTLAWLSRYRRLSVRYERRATSTRPSSISAVRSSASTTCREVLQCTLSSTLAI
jgi:transposase